MFYVNPNTVQQLRRLYQDQQFGPTPHQADTPMHRLYRTQMFLQVLLCKEVDLTLSNGQMLCTGVGSGGDFLDVFLNSILEHDSLDDLG